MSHDTVRLRWLLRCIIRYNYTHAQMQTRHTVPNEGKKSRRPRDREKEAGDKIRNFKIRNMSRQQRACTEAEIHTDTDRHRDTESRERLTRLNAKRDGRR